jgi:hypothetical protein
MNMGIMESLFNNRKDVLLLVLIMVGLLWWKPMMIKMLDWRTME